MNEPRRRELREEIDRLKEERSALILSHNYQLPDVQDAADYVADSLGLARRAAAADEETIVLCGVHFMAETVKILAPEKTVLLPSPDAGCPMADMVTADDLRRFKLEHPEARIVTYVNSSAAVKAESDVVCTSANAETIVRSLGPGEILFVPDRNLARFVTERTGIEMASWPGFCPTHERITADAIKRAKTEHTLAEVVAHPECTAEVAALADVILSTSAMIDHVSASPAEEFIIATEMGMLHPLRKANPEKRFFLPAEAPLCPNMKLTTLLGLRDSLRDLKHPIEVPRETRERALQAVQRMVAIS